MAVHQKSVFCLILGRKICILPNLKVKKSVYTDKISKSGRPVNACSAMPERKTDRKKLY